MHINAIFASINIIVIAPPSTLVQEKKSLTINLLIVWTLF